jgi:diacylglycerol kinase (ATP)
MQSAVIIANPKAGGGRARVIAERSARTLSDHGINTRLVLPASLAAMHIEVAEACERKPSAVIACGGDGTVHQVLQGAAETGVAMSVIPAGTGNDIARSLGIDVKDRESWLNRLSELIHSGEESRVDLSRITHDDREVWSLGVISAGFDSAVNERANRLTRLRGTPRYVAALLGELRSFRMHDYEITIDGMSLTGRALLIAVGNGESYGGGMRICPSADMSDGVLDVTWVDTAPRRTVLRVFPRIFSGRHVEHPLVSTYRGREITISSRGSVIYADGERIGAPPVRIAIEPGALRILRP